MSFNNRLSEFEYYNEFGQGEKLEEPVYRFIRPRRAVNPPKAFASEKAEIRPDDHIDRGPSTYYDVPEKDIMVIGENKWDIRIAAKRVSDCSGFSPQLKRNLQRMNIIDLRIVQRYAFPLMTGKERKDVVFCARSGHGKSLAYLLPIITNCAIANHGLNPDEIHTVHNPSVLILLQRNEVASQIKQTIEKLTTGTGVILGTAIGSEPRADEIQNYNLRGADILIATTGRLLDYLNVETPFLFLKTVHTVIFDDAEWFMSDDEWIHGISILKEFLSENYHTFCFCSTLDENSLENLGSFVKPDHLLIDIAARNTVEKGIKQCFMDIKKKERTAKLIKLLLSRVENNRYPKTIIFTNCREVSGVLASRLMHDHALPHTLKKHVAAFNSAISPKNRQVLLDAFTAPPHTYRDNAGETNEIDILVASDIAAAGIDFKNVKIVINFEFPINLCAYATRIGRTGREYDEENPYRGEAFTFVDSTIIRNNPARHEKNMIEVLIAASKAGADIPQSLGWLINRTLY